MARFSGDILKGSSLTLILTLLEEQPMYGYQLAKEIHRRSEGALHFRQAILYPALHQLEKEGLVEGRWEASPQGPRRRYYHLTRRGRREAGVLRRRWAAFSTVVNQVLEGGGRDQ